MTDPVRMPILFPLPFGIADKIWLLSTASRFFPPPSPALRDFGLYRLEKKIHFCVAMRGEME